MVTSPYFNNFQFTGEQRLLDMLVKQAIQLYGQDMWYLPRKINNMDNLINEDDSSSYSTKYLVDILVKTYDGFSGEGSFASKFGFEIRDKITFTIARITFEEDVGRFENTTRPKEGDLIYFPLNKKCFQIKYVDDKPFFYQFGKLQMFDLSCELFEYSSEIFNTGIYEIDSLQEKYSLDTFNWDITTSSGLSLYSASNSSILSVGFDIETIDPSADNDVIQTESDLIDDKTKTNIFGYE